MGSGSMTAVPITIFAMSGLFVSGGIAAFIAAITDGSLPGSGSPASVIWAAGAVLAGAGTLLGWLGKQITTGNMVMRNTTDELDLAKEARNLALADSESTRRVLAETHALNLELVGELAVVRDTLYRLGIQDHQRRVVARPDPSVFDPT